MGQTSSAWRFGFRQVPVECLVFAPSYDGLVVRTEGHSPNWSQMWERTTDGLKRGCLPEPGFSKCSGPVSRSCPDRQAVGTDGERQDQLFMAIQLAQWLAGTCTPQFNDSVSAARE